MSIRFIVLKLPVTAGYRKVVWRADLPSCGPCLLLLIPIAPLGLPAEIHSSSHLTVKSDSFLICSHPSRLWLEVGWLDTHNEVQHNAYIFLNEQHLL